MTTAHVHRASLCDQAIRSCELAGSPDAHIDCAKWHRKLLSARSELFFSLDAIGWSELSYAARCIENYDYPPNFAGATELKTDLLAICDHFQTIVKKFGTNPDLWEPGAATVQLVHASSWKHRKTAPSLVGQNASKSDLLKRIQDLERELEDRHWLKQIATNKTQRATFLKVILAMAIAKYGYRSESPKNTAASHIVADTEDCQLSVSDRTIRDYLRRGALLRRDVDTWDDDWLSEQ